MIQIFLNFVIAKLFFNFLKKKKKQIFEIKFVFPLIIERENSN